MIGKNLKIGQVNRQTLLVSSIGGARNYIVTGHNLPPEPLVYEDVNKLCTSDSKIRKIRLGTGVCVLNTNFNTWTFESTAYRYIFDTGNNRQLVPQRYAILV